MKVSDPMASALESSEAKNDTDNRSRWTSFKSALYLSSVLSLLALTGCQHIGMGKKPTTDTAAAVPDEGDAVAAAPTTSASAETPDIAGQLILKPSSEVASAAMRPFEDIGLKRERIPQSLKSIKTPYANEGMGSCDNIGSEILALDLVLGPDVDVRLAEQTLRQKGMDAAGDALVDAVESTATSVIPFRGWVREISGASRRERRLAAAVQAGKLRRAYLKGLGQAMQCQPPAAPLPYVEK